MGEYKRLALLIIIMIGVAVVVGTTALGVYYNAGLEREQQRLANFADSQARLIEALAPAGLPEILEEQRRLREQGAGQTAELQLARREGDVIVFLTPARGSHHPPNPVAISSRLAEPMSQALSGRSGTMIGRDYAGRRVLAAFKPLSALELGLVAKIDKAEIDGRYLRAGLIAGLVALAVVVGAAFLFIRLGEPVIRRMRESETRFRELFEHMGSGVAVYEAVADGSDFVFKDLNRAGEHSEHLRRQDVIGKRLTEIYPRIREFGLVDVLQRVWQTGTAESLAARQYRDEWREDWWRENYVYKLPSGEVVALFDDVSERIRAEQALRQSEARYRTLVEEQPDPICQFLPDTTLTFVNRAYAAFYGREPGELIGRRWLDFTAKDERPRFLDELSTFTPEHPERHEETRSTGADGTVRWYLYHLHAFFDDAGQVLSFQTFATDITKRKRAEEALLESEARLRRTVENAPFPIMVHAEDGDVVHLSRAWLELTGYACEEIATIAAWTERAYGERKDVVRADIDRLYALNQTMDEGEYRIRTKDGRTRVWAFHSAPVGSDSRGRRLVVSMAADVTERKEAERALRESELRMRALLDASQDEILLLSTQGQVLSINKAAERRLARRTGGADPVGAHLYRLLPQDQAEQRMAIVREVAATATRAHREVLIRSRWFEFWFYPVLPPDGLVREVAVYAREITEHKIHLTELSKLSQAIQQSPMSVIITDRDGVIEYVNPEFTKVAGYTVKEASGQNPRILKSGHTPPELYVELWNTITGGGAWRGELLNKKKNGELFWELVSIAPVKEGETITNFVAVKEDITERKETEEQLRQSQKMQAVGQLTGGIAHDFNNLLAIIMGNLQLLEMRMGSDAKAREYLDDALWSALRGGDLTHRLLAFARKQPLKPAVIDLNDVVKGITELLRRTLGASIRIEASLAPDLWKAFADRGELERALVNLAVNSRDAMRNAGTLTLETRNAVLDEDYADQHEEVTPGRYVLLAVTDTGAGMAPETMQRAFEPFFTTKDVGQGSGLGLSMVYGFVKQSGGHISIYSRAGHGTCVKLYLPRAPSPPVRSEEGLPDVPIEGFGQKIILVVEDEAKLRKVAVQMLDRLGLQTLQAETAKDALGLLADTRVDVLFTDIELPGGMNGIELADAAREMDPNIKVLFTTGYAHEAALHDLQAQNKVPWLFKPYSHIELARALKPLLVPTPA